MSRSFSHLVNYTISVERDAEDVIVTGDYNLAGVNLGGMKDTTALEEVFFRNPSFGVNRRNNQMFRTIGCDYCFWTIHFRNRFRYDLSISRNILSIYIFRQQIISKRYPELQISTNTDNNLKQAVDSNLVCLFKNRQSECPREIIK